MTSLGNSSYAIKNQSSVAAPWTCGRYPTSMQNITRQGGVSRGLKSAWFELTISPLSQARPIGGLHRAAPLPFRSSYFTIGLHPPMATLQRLKACLYRLRSERPKPFAHSILALRGALPSRAPGCRSHQVSIAASKLGVASPFLAVDTLTQTAWTVTANTKTIVRFLRRLLVCLSL